MLAYQVEGPELTLQQQQQQQQPQSLLSQRLEGYWSRAGAAEHQGGALPEWPTPTQRTRRARRAVPAAEHGPAASVPPTHPSWQAERASRRAPGEATATEGNQCTEEALQPVLMCASALSTGWLVLGQRCPFRVESIA